MWVDGLFGVWNGYRRTHSLEPGGRVVGSYVDILCCIDMLTE